MKLSGYKEAAEYHTGKLSDINRHLAFAGIAVIWIFKSQGNDNIIIIPELVFPTLCFVIALFLDLLHYLYSSTVWSIFYRFHEKRLKIKDRDKNIEAPPILPDIAYVIFYLKVLACVVAYIFLGKYLFIILW